MVIADIPGLQKGFENICLLLGYIITADGKVETRETQLLNDFIRLNGLGNDLKNEVMKIIANDENRIPLHLIISQLSMASTMILEQAIIAGLVIGYGDGDLDDTEEAVLEQLMKKSNFDTATYQVIKKVVAENPTFPANKN